MAALTAKSKLPTYKHLSREERHQIYSLLKAKKSINKIARFLGRNRSTTSRNARCVGPKIWADVAFFLGIEWSPEQMANKVGVSH